MKTRYNTVCGFLSAEVIFKVIMSDVTDLTRRHVFMLHEPYADLIIGKLSFRKKCSMESYSVESMQRD